MMSDDRMARDKAEALAERRFCQDEPGVCQTCGEPRRERECVGCGVKALVIDCGHYWQPRPISASPDGKDRCSNCSEHNRLVGACEELYAIHG